MVAAQPKLNLIRAVASDRNKSPAIRILYLSSVYYVIRNNVAGEVARDKKSYKFN